jgi:molybdenum cofactor cytidylyltransferase
MTTPVTGILLAAGRSTRFGSDKLLLPLPDGTPMAVACARSLCSALSHCIAVVEDPHSEVARRLALAGMEIVVNPRARDGMGSSIAAGVSANPSAAGWIIALADMPRVPTGISRRIADLLAKGADIAAPVCNGRRGHPVGFSAHHAAALQALDGEQGARDLLEAAGERVSLVETNDDGVLFDIDTPEALALLNVK